MDFKGQKLAEQLYMIIVTITAIVSFAVGYMQDSFQLMMTIFAAGVGLACLICIPDWPWYNKHGLQWLQPSSKAVRRQAGKSSKSKKKPVPTWKNFWNLF